MAFTQGKDIDPGMVDRVSGKSYAQNSSPATNWFAPLQPLQPVAPVGSPARSFDYLTGVNLVINPRNDELVSFDQMRYVAENCTLVRLAIETRKDQLAKQKWDIRLSDDNLTAEQRKKATKNDPRVKKVKDFFRSPDKEYSWDAWVRRLMEEVLVTDAPAIYMRRTFGGDPYSAMLIDGATVTRKFALDGTTPLPPDVAYQQIIKGVPYNDFTTDEMLYRPRNPRVHKGYGYSPTEQAIFMANIIMRRDLFKLNTYTEGNMPPALLSVKDNWTADQIEDFQKKFDAMNGGNIPAMRKLQFIPEINQLYLLKQDALKDDADEWFARIVMYAFSLPPTALTKQMNRATAEQAQESAEDEGLAPLMNWVRDLVNDLIRKMFGYTDLEFVWTPEKVVNPKEQAEIHTAYIKAGVLNRDEARAELGLDPVPGGDVYTIETTTGLIPLVEAVMTTEDKVEAGTVPDPTTPKPSPFAAAPDAENPKEDKAEGGKEEPEDKAEERNKLAKVLMDTYEDLHPELRDPVIVSKLVELEKANG